MTDYDVRLKDLLASTASHIDCSPTEITNDDIANVLESIMMGRPECSCGRGVARYDVSSPGVMYDLMCGQCFRETTEDGNVIWLQN